MKIKPEHYKIMKDAITTFEAEHIDDCKAHKAAHNPVRYMYDVSRAVKLYNFYVDVLYPYGVNDDHIKTALLKIYKESTI